MGLSNLSFSATNVSAGKYADAPISCTPGDIYICTDGDGITIPNTLICQIDNSWIDPAPEVTGDTLQNALDIADGALSYITSDLSTKVSLVDNIGTSAYVTLMSISGGSSGTQTVTLKATGSFKLSWYCKGSSTMYTCYLKKNGVTIDTNNTNNTTRYINVDVVVGDTISLQWSASTSFTGNVKIVGTVTSETINRSITAAFVE
jgi:hypothetical protein